MALIKTAKVTATKSPEKRTLLNPTLRTIINETTDITVGIEYLKDDYTQDRGQVLDGNSVDGYAYTDRLNPEMFFGIPDWNSETSAESTRIYFDLSQEVTENYYVNFFYSQTDNDKLTFDSSPYFIDSYDDDSIDQTIDAEGNIFIDPRKSNGKGKAKLARLSNHFEIDGDIKHQIMLSANYEEASSKGQEWIAYDLIYNIYSNTFKDLDFTLEERKNPVDTEFHEYGVNIHDLITFNEQWSVLVGARYSKYKDVKVDYSDSDVSLRSALMYKINEQLSTYVSIAEGYAPPVNKFNLNNEPIAPEKSRLVEMGFKASIFDEEAMLSGAIYHLQRNDISFSNGSRDLEQVIYINGSVESRGFELEFSGNITENWRLVTGYTYLETEITKGGIAGRVVYTKGNEMPGVGKHNFNLWTVYEYPVFNGIFGIGSGLFYADDTYISLENKSTFDSWVRVDAMAYYKKDNWKLQLNVENLGDTLYQQAQAEIRNDKFSALRGGTSDPRTLLLSLSYEW